jgi:hypothetical protein
LDRYLFEQFVGCSETDPNQRVIGALRGLLVEIMNAVDWKDFDKNDDWKPKVDALLQKYTCLFMGVPVE